MKKQLRFYWSLSWLLLTIGMAVDTNAQPVLITEVPNNSTGYFQSGDLVYFTSGDALWRTDGTAQGTVPLQSGFEFTSSTVFRTVGNILYFTNLREPGTWFSRGKELWRSDGTSSGTFRIQVSSEYDIEILDNLDDYLFFVATNPGSGREIYKTNGGTPQLLRDIQSGAGNGFVQKGEKAGNHLFFAADDGTHGTELWVTDGTSQGTVMLRDINPGAGDGFVQGSGSGMPDGSVFVHDHELYFTGYDPDFGNEPWVSDGSSAGTRLLKDLTPGMDSSGPVEYKIANQGEVYFMVYAPDYETYANLWKTGGDAASTTFIKQVDKDHPDKNLFRVYDGKVYFFGWPLAVESYLWVTDGTPQGTQSLYSISTHEGGIIFFEEVNDYLVFRGEGQGYPTALIRSDGTAAGTTAVTRFNSEGFLIGPRDLTVVNDLLFYADHDGPSNQGYAQNPEDSYQLMQTDARTVQSVRTLHGGAYAETADIVNFNEKVLFTAFGTAGDNQKKLWLYDPHAHTGYFTLVNADTDEDITRIDDGDVLTKPSATNINIRYNPVTEPGSVVFELNGRRFRTETAAPYAMAGDIGGNYSPWKGAGPGEYRLTATSYSASGGNGTPGENLTINFTLQTGSDCNASGTILREQWNNIPGSQVSLIPVDNPPSVQEQLSIFEGPSNHGTKYGARIRGYICPPLTGDYTFWIASNDHSALWLSTDDNPDNKLKVAYLTAATAPHQWDKFATQRSQPIKLTAGKRYYIEALHKQGVGTDHLAVGWQLPDGTMERPIAGSHLSPYPVAPLRNSGVTRLTFS